VVDAEASWANLTISAARACGYGCATLRQLTLGDPAVRDAADALGLLLP